MSASIERGRPLAALIAFVAWFGVVLQLYLSLRMTGSMGMSTAQGLAIYFGYFTVLTNILVGLAVCWPIALPTTTLGRFFVRPAAIGWVAASIAFVGVAYFMLLRHVWNPHGLQLLADVLMHYIVPALVLIHSGIALRHTALRWTAPLWWSLYPVVYFVYVLLRGALLGRYPYRFIDVSQLGYTVTLRHAAGLWVAFLLLAYVLMALWRIPRAVNPRGRTQP